MWIENKIIKEDLEYINSVDFINWHKLENKTIFVTGATGLIGFYFTNALLFRNTLFKSNIKVIALVRNIEKAQKMFGKELNAGYDIKFVVGDIENLPEIGEDVDFIVHGASPTESKFFVEKPVETIKTSVLGTLNVLEFAKRKQITGLVYLSSMEVYGDNQEDRFLNENDTLKLNSNNLRDCYPIGKCLNENLCLAYVSEYGVPINCLRVSQTIGFDLFKPVDSKRLVAYIADCIANKKDIVLQTKGTSKRTYVHVRDVVTAILLTLTSDKFGEIFNVSNEKSYSSVYELADFVAKEVAAGEIKVVVKESDSNKFPKPNFLHLDNSKLRKLGWKESVSLVDMFKRMVQ